MKNEPLVSVIVPIYKVEQYLNRCIDSILSQTYERLEILLIDDGSPDNSGKIADDYALSESRIQVFHKANGGLSDARNIGLDNSHGEFVCFVDSDDWLPHDAIQSLISPFLRHDENILFSQGAFLFIDEAGNSEKAFYPYKLQEETIDKMDFLNHFHNDYGTVWNKMFRKKSFENLRFLKGIFHEDLELMPRLICNTKESKIYNINSIVYYYYQSNNSITRLGNESIRHEKDIYYILIERLGNYNDDRLGIFNKGNIDGAFWILNPLLVKKNEDRNELVIKHLKRISYKDIFQTPIVGRLIKIKMILLKLFSTY